LLAEEQEVIAFIKKQGGRVTLNKTGQATKLSLNAESVVSIKRFQSIAKLKHLEELAVNMPPGGDGDWAFLRKMPALKKLTIWMTSRSSHYILTSIPLCAMPSLRSGL
jgi:hypothetical protein